MGDQRRDMDAVIAEYARAMALPSMGYNARVDEALEHAATVAAVDWIDVLWKVRAAPISPKLDATELMWFPPKDGAAFVEKIDSLIARSDIGSLAERLFKSAKRDAERLAGSH